MISPLKFIPLGGLGQIGMNMMILECGEDAILIDCGVMFPDSSHYGVDLIIPNFTYVLKIKHKIRGLVLTHGHEDHIGAVPYLLKHINVPIYGSKFTLALVESKLAEHHIRFKVRFEEIYSHQTLKLGSFKIEFLPVSHSIIDGMGLAIDTPQGIIMHTSDFKIDLDLYHGKKITLDRFKEYGKKGILALLSDSTNVERTGKSLSEEEIKQEIFKIFKSAQGRIIFSVFATNIRRIEQVLELAKSLKRRVALSGKSIETNVEIARNLGIIHPRVSSVLIDISDIEQIRPQELIIVCTGSQAEYRSALWRMSVNEHREVVVNEKDTIILSSKFIPGNEKEISHLINNLCRRGAKVLYEKIAQVHVSGHAWADELKTMMQIVKPKYFIPIHGEYRFLIRHAELAESARIPYERIFVCENGDEVVFQSGKASRGEGILANPVFIDGHTTREIDTIVLRERRVLSEAGIIVAVLSIRRKDQSIILGPHLISKGVIEERDETLLKRAESHVRRFVRKPFLSRNNLEDILRLEVRRFFKREVGKKPVVIPLVIDF